MAAAVQNRDAFRASPSNIIQIMNVYECNGQNIFMRSPPISMGATFMVRH